MVVLYRVVGLQEENFYLTENMRPVSKLKMLGAASNNTDADITLIIDRSVKSESYRREIESTVREIAASMKDMGTLRIVAAGNIPAVEYIGKPGSLGDFSLDALKTKQSSSSACDLALRLASNDLINAAKKRGIILITSGSDSNLTFNNYNLAELSAYMSNNSISFSVVQLDQGAVSEELDYVVNTTQGELYYVYRPQGLSDVVKDIIEFPQGIYQLSYTSALSTNFGTNYLPLEAEVYLLNRSGRDETGYFAPLE